MRETLRRHCVVLYLAVTFAVTWSAWLGLAASGHVVAVGFSPIYLLGLLGPMAGAVATTAIAHGTHGLRELGARMVRFRVGLSWWGAAIALPLALAAATYLVLLASSMFLLAPVELPTASAFGKFVGYPITSPLALTIFLFAINGLGEETGWRGFLLSELQRRWSPLKASGLVAIAWGLWHVPAFLINANYLAMPTSLLPMFFVGLACGSVVLTWLYNRGRQSIALVAAWHAIYNLLSGSVAAKGALAAVESTAVIAIAIILAIRELRAAHCERHHRPARHVLAPGGT